MYMVFHGQGAVAADAHHWKDVLDKVDAIRQSEIPKILNSKFVDPALKGELAAPVRPLWYRLGMSSLLQNSKEFRKNTLDLNALYRGLVLLDLSGLNTIELIAAMYKAGIQIVVVGATSDTDSRLKASIRLRRGDGQTHKAVIRQMDLIKVVEVLLELDKNVKDPVACCMIAQMECKVVLYNRICPNKGLGGWQIDNLVGPLLQLEGFTLASIDGAQDLNDADRYIQRMSPDLELNSFILRSLEETTLLVNDIGQMSDQHQQSSI